MSKSTSFIVALTIAIVGASALADTIQFSDSVPLRPTGDWQSSVSIPRFNPSWGTLQSIEWRVTGHVQGSAGFESRDATPATVTMDVSAMLKLMRPDNSQLVLSIPLTSTLDNVTAFDGTRDYAGTSGKTYAGLSADEPQSESSSLAADLSLFTGTGNIILPFSGHGASTGSGAGQLDLNFSTDASANVDVTYTFVPEPGALGLLGVGAICLLRRKRM